jgi:hypothetical protein
MKRMVVALLAVIALLAPAGSSVAWAGGRGHGHGHVGFRTHVFIGPYWGPYWGRPLWWDPYWYPPAYAAPPVIVREEPPVYIQQPAPEASSYWYYCESAKAYYPYVRECPAGWLKVVPSQPAQ